MGITTALTPQWVVSSLSSCTNFWLLLPLSPSPPARLRPTPGMSMEPTQLSTTPTPTGPDLVLQESAPPALDAMARGALMLSQRLMLRLILCTIMPPTVTPTSTDLTTPLATLDLSLEPATSPFIVSTRERLRLMLMLATCTLPTLATPPTATDTVWPELLDTPEPPPPSLPGAPRDWARGALTPSQDTWLTATLLSSQCPTPPTAMEILDK